MKSKDKKFIEKKEKKPPGYLAASEEFCREVKNKDHEMIELICSFMRERGLEAARVIHDMIHSEDESIKLNAAKTFLDRTFLVSGIGRESTGPTVVINLTQGQVDRARRGAILEGVTCEG